MVADSFLTAFQTGAYTIDIVASPGSGPGAHLTFLPKK
jgi:hypothetical protein